MVSFASYRTHLKEPVVVVAVFGGCKLKLGESIGVGSFVAFLQLDFFRDASVNCLVARSESTGLDIDGIIG